MFVCEVCGKEFDKDWRCKSKGVPRCCSRACSNTRTHSASTIAKIRLSVAKVRASCKGIASDTPPEVRCLNCGKIIGVGHGVILQRRRHCSAECKRQYADKAYSILFDLWKKGEDVSNLISYSESYGVASGELIRKYKELIKDYLLEEGGHSCNICGISDEWYGKTLSFVLDHINGNWMDQRKENLRLICPNCDSQLATSRGKNRGKGRVSKRYAYHKLKQNLEDVDKNK
jgi:hypothetical protein